MKLLLQIDCAHCATLFAIELGEVWAGVPMICPHCRQQRLLGREEAWRLLRTLSEELRAASSVGLAAVDDAGRDGQRRSLAAG